MNTAIYDCIDPTAQEPRRTKEAQCLDPSYENPDTYHGTRTPHAAESWLRSVQRYADVTGMDEVDRVNMPSIFFEEMLTHDEFRPRNAKQTARDPIVAALTQTGTVEEYLWTVLYERLAENVQVYVHLPIPDHNCTS
ncbi:hypothetical protein O0I10_002019 [Lichtheimia ornata]|uniref:Uncharacterized protein n=1 Tax=Lichtheimia ornata TaxID=688661 RepID=A0AAD7VCA3_9FUNG|nr:uncharacterized protein O0I10_002019 [Lichtheimia ornata]KAJ8662325.1 hypothetical protein O0I10_002019 [Lichtheimia ornata]